MNQEQSLEHNEFQLETNRITEKIIACVYRVSNLLINFGKPRVEIKRIVLDF